LEECTVARLHHLDQPILIVEDCPEDYEVTVRSFKKAGVTHPLVRCEDGEEALDFLYGRGRYAEARTATRPILVLLDLNLPGIDGREVLASIKQDEHLRLLPVIVLTTSIDERDIYGCYRAGANSYMQKPVDLDELMRGMMRLKDYWLESVILPG
jgi:CheY-like chemotaxis protein